VSELKWPIGRNETKQLFLVVVAKMVQTVSVWSARLRKFRIIIKLALKTPETHLPKHLGLKSGKGFDLETD